ncbi:hypothetical protein GCM10010168_63980 [Actinoplanes ianthinogenes]|uniref:Uncharacterized protein n=1 Tax=Actinoplanes ianthinogenes TaxID=122358 RepID=A0ABN6C4W4_9ACTN|nr:hypothetical protein [Actinoplanes ianthinogenes]BCJ39354.1 hypothetical protein Aiant_00110 [Actinoplanes ianthinogenes]GGR36690.1 hypothetical protein GCM10010168_63980 [Actinoplanes ianthinogenes]
MTAVAESADLQKRRVELRRRELLLTLERWGPAYREVAGDSLSYVCEIAGASEPEEAFLREHVAKHGMPQVVGRTADEILEAGRRANAAASAAFLAGDYDKARDLIDDARLYGALLDTEWVKLHGFIAAKAAAS